MSGCGCGTWVGGNSPNVWLEDPALDENKMTQSDLRFCENDTSERCKNNEKWGQQDHKSRRKLV